MRKLAVGIAGFLLFCVGSAFGQRLIFNGTLWKSSDLSIKAFYVAGFAKGHAVGVMDGYKQMLKAVYAAFPINTWTPSETKAFVKKGAEIDKAAAGSKVTIQQVESTVSTFYDDYRNTPVCWDDAIQFSVSSLKGNAPSEETLDAARKRDAKQGCR